MTSHDINQFFLGFSPHLITDIEEPRLREIFPADYEHTVRAGRSRSMPSWRWSRNGNLARLGSSPHPGHHSIRQPRVRAAVGHEAPLCYRLLNALTRSLFQPLCTSFSSPFNYFRTSRPLWSSLRIPPAQGRVLGDRKSKVLTLANL